MMSMVAPPPTNLKPRSSEKPYNTETANGPAKQDESRPSTYSVSTSYTGMGHSDWKDPIRPHVRVLSKGKQGVSKVLVDEAEAPANLEKSALFRQWSSHAGRIREHANPDDDVVLGRRMLRGENRFALADETPAQRSVTLQGYESVEGSHDITTSSSSEQHGENSNSNFPSMSPQRNATTVALHKNLWDSAKSGYDSAKHGISIGFDSAGHRLGLWDGSERGAGHSTMTTATSSSASHYPLATSAFPPHETHIDQHVFEKSPVADATEHDSTNHHLKASTIKTTAGLSALGALTTIALILLFAYMIKRKLFKGRKGKKGGRYGHLDGDSDAWKGFANGDRELGILAMEFDEFDEETPIKMDEEEDLEGGRRH